MAIKDARNNNPGGGVLSVPGAALRKSLEARYGIKVGKDFIDDSGRIHKEHIPDGLAIDKYGRIVLDE